MNLQDIVSKDMQDAVDESITKSCISWPNKVFPKSKRPAVINSFDYELAIKRAIARGSKYLYLSLHLDGTVFIHVTKPKRPKLHIVSLNITKYIKEKTK